MTINGNIRDDADVVKREPTADQRSAARTLHGMYTALVDAGFDVDQALALTCTFLTTVVTGES